MKNNYYEFGALKQADLSKLDDKVYTYRIVGEKLGAVYCLYEKGWDHVDIVHANEEFLYIIEGHLKAEVGGNHYELKQGDAILIPSNQPHTFVATETTKALVMFAPPITSAEAQQIMDDLKQKQQK